MLQPKKTKYRKQFRLRGQGKGISSRGAKIAYGEIAIKSMEGAEITSRQIESARRTMARAVKRGGKIWIRVFPDKILTAKSGEVPMGSGKGAPDHWVCQIKPGKILFEMAGVEESLMRHAMKLATYKLPVKCKIVTNEI